MRNVVAQVKNIRSFAEAGGILQGRDPGVPGIGLVYGPSGYGKTTAAAWYANQCDAVYVRALATWTPISMLGAIMRELDAKPLARCAAMVDYIVERLALSGRPLFVDEADYLVDSKKLVESLRDLHDLSTSPLILIGMKAFQTKVSHREQLVGRVNQWVEFARADLDDARVLADAVCEVAIDDELLARLHKSAGGSMRGLTVGLSRIEFWARTRGRETVAVADWGDQPFVMPSARAPSTRHMVARGAGAGR